MFYFRKLLILGSEAEVGVMSKLGGPSGIGNLLGDKG